MFEFTAESQPYNFEEVLDHANGLNGSGYFPEVVKSIHGYLLTEMKQNRITGTQYTEMLIPMFQYATQHAFAFGIERAKSRDAFELQLQGMKLDLHKFEVGLEHDFEKQSKEHSHSLNLKDIENVHDTLRQDKANLHDLSKQTKDHAHDTSKQATDITHDKYKFDLTLGIQEDKLALETLANAAQIKLTEAQARAFKGKHNKDLAKLIMDIVTVGVSQEQMDILAGPNTVFGGISPSTVFSNAVWPISV